MAPEPVIPVVVESEKVLPDSESNPTWLLELTAQKQAELDARLAASAAATAAQSTNPNTVSTDNSVSVTPKVEAPTTVVAGVSTTPAKVIADKLATNVAYAHQTPEFTVLLIALALFGFGTLLILWRLNKKEF
jgi:hypothetical protein